MIRYLPRNILRFAFLVLIQVFVFNNIQLSGYINPYIYVLFILLLPYETPGWLVLFTGFALGGTIDFFSGTLGIHAAATVFMAYMRHLILDVISPRDGYEPGSLPRIYYYGFQWFLKYSLILVFCHHLALFYLEVFELDHFFQTLGRVLASTVVTVFFILISQYLIFRR